MNKYMAVILSVFSLLAAAVASGVYRIGMLAVQELMKVLP